MREVRFAKLNYQFMWPYFVHAFYVSFVRAQAHSPLPAESKSFDIFVPSSGQLIEWKRVEKSCPFLTQKYFDEYNQFLTYPKWRSEKQRNFWPSKVSTYAPRRLTNRMWCFSQCTSFQIDHFILILFFKICSGYLPGYFDEFFLSISKTGIAWLNFLQNIHIDHGTITWHGRKLLDCAKIHLRWEWTPS